MRFLKAFLSSLLIMPFLAFAISETEVQDVMKLCVDEGHTQGMVVGIIDEDGTRFYKYGKMGIDDPRPIDENAVFETGSISKIFTTLLLAKMVEDGEIKLDDPIEKFFPDNVKIPAFQGKKITLDHLATHTAGFPYMPDNFIMNDMYDPFSEYTVEYIHEMLNNFELPYAPGSKYQYSNICIGLLGHILSQVANKDFEELVYEKILKPLDMQDTKIHLTEEMFSRFASAHMKDKKVPHWNVNSFYGAGGLHSTPKDLARLVEANLGFYKTDFYPLLQSAIKSKFPQDMPYINVGHEWNISYKYQPEFVYHGGAVGGQQLFIGFCPTTKKV